MKNLNLNIKLYQATSLFSFIIYISSIFFGTSGPNWQEHTNKVEDIVMTNPMNQVVYSFVFLLSVISIVPHYKDFFRWINKEKYILLFLFWCGLTIIWSIDYTISLKRYFQYIVTSLACISVLLNFGQQEILVKTLKIVLLLYVLITIGVILTFPQAIDPSWKTWRGLHAGKNNLGQTAGLCIIFFSYLVITESTRLKKIVYLFFLVLSVTLLVGSFSMTPMLILSFLFFYFTLRYADAIFMKIRIGKTVSSLIILSIILIIVVIMLVSPEMADSFLYSIGKDPTFTDRTDIWYMLLTSSVGDLIKGVGFQAFWIPAKLSTLTIFEYWLPNQGHNGYVDIILEVGIIGLIFFVILLFDMAKNKFNKNNVLWLVFILFALLINMSESTLIRPHHFTNVFFFLSFWTTSYKLHFNKNLEEDPNVN